MTGAELLMITMLVTIEARGEPEICQELVVDTTMARVADPRWPDTIEGVLSQRKQYPWWKTRWEHYRRVPERVKLETAVKFANYTIRDTNMRFFYNPRKATTDPKKSAGYKMWCGNHVFKGLEPNILD